MRTREKKKENISSKTVLVRDFFVSLLDNSYSWFSPSFYTNNGHMISFSGETYLKWRGFFNTRMLIVQKRIRGCWWHHMYHSSEPLVLQVIFFYKNIDIQPKYHDCDQLYCMDLPLVKWRFTTTSFNLYSK